MRKLISVTLIATLLLAITACGKPKNAADWLSLGEKYLLDLDYEQAIVALDEAIKLEPKEPRHRVVQIIIYILDDNPAGAQEAQQQAQDDNVPGFPDLPPIPDRPDDLKPDEFFPPVIGWLNSNGWVDFVLRLLELLGRRWPEVAWFGEALELIQDNQGFPNEQTTKKHTIDLPDKLFSEQEIRDFGITSEMDVHQIAALFGFSRSEAWTNVFGDYSYGTYKYSRARDGSAIAVDDREGVFEINATMNLSGKTYPHGITIGMQATEVLKHFYYGNEELSRVINGELDLESFNSDHINRMTEDKSSRNYWTNWWGIYEIQDGDDYYTCSFKNNYDYKGQRVGDPQYLSSQELYFFCGYGPKQGNFYTRGYGYTIFFVDSIVDRVYLNIYSSGI